MPLYRCFSEAEALDDEQRAAIARAVTDIHCDETGAPPTFVHVQFHDRDPERATAPNGASGREAGDGRGGGIRLHGGLRAGRPPEVTAAIVDRCRTEVAAVAGIDVDDIVMRTSETPASWIFEGGRVLPEPGEEDAWLAAAPSPATEAAR